MRQFIIDVPSFNYRQIQNMWLCRMIFIGNEICSESDSIIIQEIDDNTLSVTGNIKIVKGTFNDNDNSLLTPSKCLLSSGYTHEGVGVLLGLSGVRKSDNLECVKITR